ncbi:alpha/beta hydrolase family protein [Pseudidiomarina terrestris]|uniref:S9 family peptidase n=1 Tax=Pseudidiomarina terrestris TaxID=2820060 RepID=UPI00264ACA0B|nr:MULTISPECIES: S9 family peptidase [unclassified Pseudidiomarina]MDN7126867.1 S9 family peptidase [Pseudidiomarina sp. 1APR75-33.1]MDN7134614.1 S9 family peptidase [Pseudidiomarina sp. 1ASP75-5]MDN7136716.1 S9 family peptidase [Pseudidiomarina sp. 1ASP75-14]
MKYSILVGLAALVIPALSFSSTVDTELLENYAKHAQYLDVKISPKGDYLAATSRITDGSVQLTVIDIDDSKILSVTQGQGNESVGSFQWANNERLVMTMVREVGSLDQPVPTGELFAMDADGSKQVILTGPRSESGEYVFAQVVDYLPEQPDAIMIYQRSFTSAEPYLDLYTMKITSGRKRSEGRIPLKAYRSTNVQVVLDDQGVSRMVLGIDPEDGNKTVILGRDGANQDWYEVTSYYEEEGGFVPLLMLPGTDQVVGLSDSESDTRALSVLDISSKEETILAEHPATDLMPIMSVKNGRANEVIGAAFEQQGIDTFFFSDVKDKDYSNLVQSLIATFPGQSVSINSSTRDNRILTVRVESVNSPTKFYMFDRDKGKLASIAAAKPWLEGHPIPKTKTIVYKSRDGLDIYGLLTLPNGSDAKDLPLILLPHGGPHGIRDTMSRMDSDAKVFAEHGYAVFQPNFRGSGGYGREFLELGYKNWGTTMINDMTDGVQHLIKEGIADQDRVCVYGASYGGYAAVQSGVREPDLYQCIVGFVGVYDLNLMYEQGDIQQARAGRNYLDQVLPSAEEGREAQSPVYNVDKLKAPVFIIQGGADVRVPEAHAFALRDALKERDHPYEWMYKEAEGHGFYKPENNVERWQKMLAFFDKYIGE